MKGSRVTSSRVGKKTEMNVQQEGKARPGGAKPSEWQRGRPRSEQRLQKSSGAAGGSRSSKSR